MTDEDTVPMQPLPGHRGAAGVPLDDGVEGGVRELVPRETVLDVSQRLHARMEVDDDRRGRQRERDNPVRGRARPNGERDKEILHEAAQAALAAALGGPLEPEQIPPAAGETNGSWDGVRNPQLGSPEKRLKTTTSKIPPQEPGAPRFGSSGPAYPPLFLGSAGSVTVTNMGPAPSGEGHSGRPTSIVEADPFPTAPPNPGRSSPT